MNFILRIILLILIVWGVSYLLTPVDFPDVKSNQDYTYLIMVGLIIAIFNAVFKPIIKILAFPITFLTLGLFPLFLNTILIIVLANVLSPHFIVQSTAYPYYVWAFVFATCVSVGSYIINAVLNTD